MELSVRKIAVLVGSVLLALEISDVAFVAWTRAPIGLHVPTFVALVGLGVPLVWWGRRLPTPGADPHVPSSFWTVVALAVGGLLVAYGVFLGLLFALVFNSTRALEAALVPWGIVGLGLMLLGGYRLALLGSRIRASSEVRSILSRLGNPEPPSVGNPAATGPVPRPIGDLQVEIIDAVRAAYRGTSPTIRTAFWTWYAGWWTGLLVLVVVLLPTFGTPVHVFDAVLAVRLTVGSAALLVVLALLGAVEGGFGIPARLRDFNRAEAELNSGRAPDGWMLQWWIPFLYTGRLLARQLAPPAGAGAAVPESSALATSLALLRFGRRLAWFARYWYTTVFVLILLVGSSSAFVIVFLAGTELAPGSGHLPALFLGAWVAALTTILAGFAYLYLRYRRLDPVALRLAVLEEAESQLARTFWSRF